MHCNTHNTACWTILSSSAAMPSGRRRPSDLGIQTLRDRAAQAQAVRRLRNDAERDARGRLAASLHDGVGQIMLVHYMEAEWLAQMLEPGPNREAAERLCSSLGKTLEMIRDLAMELRPPVIDDLGISSAMESLMVRHSRLRVARSSCPARSVLR